MGAGAVGGVEGDAGDALGAESTGIDEGGASAVFVVEDADQQAVGAAGVRAFPRVLPGEDDDVAFAGEDDVPRHGEVADAEVEHGGARHLAAVDVLPVGTHKYHTRQDGQIVASMKGRTPTFSDPVVKEAHDIRIKGLSGSGSLSSVLLNVINTGYREVDPPRFPVNQFVKDNALTVCTARRDENKKIVKEFNYLVMKVAGGSLDPLSAEVTYDEATRKFMFVQEGTVIIGGRASADDKVYACVFEGKQGRVALEPLRERGEAGSTSFTLPDGWDAANIFIYVFAVAADRKRSSPSTRVYPAPTAGEIAEARLAGVMEARAREEKEAKALEAIERQERMVTAAVEAHEASGKARREAVAAGQSAALANIAASRAYDEVMNAALERENELEEAVLAEEERLRAENEERERKACEKARERRRAAMK